MRKVGLSLVLASSMLLFNACGNGGSTTPTAKDVKGQFIDAPVSGLKYECDKSGLKGETNANGEYTCKEGDTVSFFAGKYKIGSTTASTGITTPYSLYPEDVQSAVNVAQLLQTLDSDGDGVITIPAGYNALDNVVSAPTADDFENVVESTMGQTLVSEEVASTNMNDNIAQQAPTINLKSLLGGKTFYIDDDDKIVFNAEVTSLILTDDEESETNTVSIDGNKLIFADDTNGDEDEDYALFVGQTSDYLIFADYEPDGTYDGETRIFYDEAKAKAYWEENRPTGTVTYNGITYTPQRASFNLNNHSVVQINIIEFDDGSGQWFQFTTAYTSKEAFDAVLPIGVPTNIEGIFYFFQNKYSGGNGISGAATITRNSNGRYSFVASSGIQSASVQNVGFK